VVQVVTVAYSADLSRCGANAVDLGLCGGDVLTNPAGLRQCLHNGGKKGRRIVTANFSTNVSKIDVIREYFHRIDRGDFPQELFTATFEFYLPKFGIGRGLAAFNELGRGVQATRIRSAHHHDTLRFIDGGDTIVVEGTTEGLGRDNVEWCGGRTPGGRFCSVFEFDGAGRIKRMYVYLDPDFTSADTDRFLWPERTQNQW
jgi:hypothetical protein